MSIAVFSTAYFPSLEYIRHILQFDEIIIETKEHFPHQTNRNRCHILGPNGIQTLTVPIKQNHIKTKIIDLKLSKYIADLQFPNFVKVLEHTKNHLSLEIENKKEQINSTLEFLNNSVDFEDISIKEPSLEEIIKTFY